MNKKDLERWKRETAERETKARSDSRDRQQNFKVLWDLKEQQLRTARNLEERGRKRSALKRQKFKKLLDSVKGLKPEERLYDEINELVELVVLQDQEIEYLVPFRDESERIKAHYPEQFRDLSLKSSMAELRPHIEKMWTEPQPKEKYDRKRRRSGLGRVGEIEREFGGEGSAPPLGNPFNALTAYERLLGRSRLLDDVFGGGGVSMLRLQELFGLHRNRFPKKLPHFKMGRETLYDYRATTKIMDALLNEKPRTRVASKRGRPARQWLSDSALRARVLSRIEEWIKSVPVVEHIAHEFVSVVRRHMPTFE